MAKTSNLNIRIDPETKSQAEAVYASYGITLTDAINIFLHKSIMESGLPFEMRPSPYNAEMELALREARAIMNGEVSAKKYPSARALFDELNAEMDRE